MTSGSLARWIELLSWAFVLLGLALPLAYDTAVFEVHRAALARWAFGAAAVPASDATLLRLMLGITGGSIAGKWIVHGLLARGPLAEGRAWARDLTMRGLAAWFFVDSLACLLVGANFNVWMINLLPMALVGLPLVLARHHFEESAPMPPPASASDPVLLACSVTALIGAATGLAIAFGGDTPLFAPWFAALERSMGRPLDEGSRRLALLWFGPIGGCTVAQFLMLAGYVRREGARRRVRTAAIVSIVGWFTIDTACGLANGGLFNIAMVNLPALAITLPAWLMLRASAVSKAASTRASVD